MGWRLENVVAIELLRRLEHALQDVYYVRESQGYEVDFAVVDGRHVKQLIQVTYDFAEPSAKLYKREVGGLLKASQQTNCDNLTLIVMYGETRDIVESGKTIHIVSAADWLTNPDKY